jgi:hypothetical protein
MAGQRSSEMAGEGEYKVNRDFLFLASLHPSSDSYSKTRYPSKILFLTTYEKIERREEREG